MLLSHTSHRQRTGTTTSNSTNAYSSTRNTAIAASTHPVFRHQPTVTCKSEGTWGAMATKGLSLLHLEGVAINTPRDRVHNSPTGLLSHTKRLALSQSAWGTSGTDTAIALPAHTLVTHPGGTWSGESQGTSLNLPVPGGTGSPINSPRDKSHTSPRRLLFWTLTLVYCYCCRHTSLTPSTCGPQWQPKAGSCCPRQGCFGEGGGTRGGGGLPLAGHTQHNQAGCADQHPTRQNTHLTEKHAVSLSSANTAITAGTQPHSDGNPRKAASLLVHLAQCQPKASCTRWLGGADQHAPLEIRYAPLQGGLLSQAHARHKHCYC